MLAKQGQDRELAHALLAESYLAATQPSFHLIPRGKAMASEGDFDAAYQVLVDETDDFTDVTATTVAAALDREPAALAPLRMMLGFTTNELAVAISVLDPSQRISGVRLKTFERRARPAGTASAARPKLIEAVAEWSGSCYRCQAPLRTSFIRSSTSATLETAGRASPRMLEVCRIRPSSISVTSAACGSSCRPRTRRRRAMLCSSVRLRPCSSVSRFPFTTPGQGRAGRWRRRRHSASAPVRIFSCQQSRPRS